MMIWRPMCSVFNTESSHTEVKQRTRNAFLNSLRVFCAEAGEAEQRSIFFASRSAPRIFRRETVVSDEKQKLILPIFFLR
jgi:hypothetical protein